MTLVKWDPFSEIVSMSQVMDRFFDEPYRTSRPSAPVSRPLGLDMYETASEVVVRAELPGVKQEDAEITLERGRLTIRAKRAHDNEADEKAVRWFSRDLWAGEYAASLTLPDSLDDAQAKAHYENGVLTLRIPKSEAAKPRQIKISTDGKVAAK